VPVTPPDEPRETESERRLAERLAAFDEAGEGQRQEAVAGLDPKESDRLERALDLASWLRQFWRPEAPSVAGTRVGRFELVKELGRGGHGVVFLAYDPVLKRQVAIKVPRPEAIDSPDLRRRFLREGRAVARLDHPGIVPVFELGEAGPVCYIASAYVANRNLAEWLAGRTTPPEPVLAARLVAAVADAVYHAHVRGVLHRDLKPSNVLLEMAEGGEHDGGGSDVSLPPRVADFGLAKLIAPGRDTTTIGALVGTPRYIAPEQLTGDRRAVGPQVDVYSLGVILADLLAGRAEGEDAVESAIARAPADLAAVLRKSLEPDPRDRYPSAADLAADLRRFLDGKPTRARRPPMWQRVWDPLRHHSAALVVLGVCAACAILILGGRGWYEGRLEGARRLSQQKEAQASAQESADRRHLEYAVDIRRAEQLIRAGRALVAQGILMRHQPRPGEDDLREFAWHYLLRRCHNERRTLTGHQDEVYSVQFSPHGDLLASAGKDGTVLIRDTRTWQPVQKIAASRTEVNDAAFSPDATTLATVDDDGKLKLWDIATGQCQMEWLAHAGDALRARFTPDGKRIITAGGKDGLVRIWDRSSGAAIGDMPGRGFALAPDGVTLASWGAGGALNFYNSCTRALIFSRREPPGIMDAVFSHDGTKLATTHEADQTVRVWDVKPGTLVGEFQGHNDGVFSVAFSADDRTIISGGDDAAIRFWDAATGVQRGAGQGHAGRVWGLALSPDGRTLASAGRDGTVKLWDSEPPLHHLKVAVSDHPSIGISSNGRRLLTLELGKSSSTLLSVARWDVRSGLLLERTPLRLSGPLTGAAFSPDGQWLAITTMDRGLTLWNSATGRLQAVLEQSRSIVVPLGFSPDGRYLLQGDPGGKLSLRDLSNGRVIAWPWETPLCATFTSSGEVIAVGGDNRFLQWDPRTGRSKSHWVSPAVHLGSVTSSQDGGMLATPDFFTHRVHLWSAETLELKNELTRAVLINGVLAFTPDMRTLASAGSDRTVTLWELATGQELMTLGGFTGKIYMLRFTADGKVLVALSSKGPGDLGPWEVFLWVADEDWQKPWPRTFIRDK